MEDAVFEEKRHGLTIKIYQDDHAGIPGEECPDEENFLVGFHRDFWVENEQVTKDQLRRYFHKEDKYPGNEYVVFPLTAYIHSGVTLYLGNIPVTPFDTASPSGRGWDTSLVGAVLIKKPVSKKAAQTMAEDLVEFWNNYLSGNVYGYVIETEGGEHLESCWGFYGDYEDYALLEARDLADTLTNKGKTDHTGQMLMFN